MYTFMQVENTKAAHLATGCAGELLAAEYLRQLGYGILERNVRFGHDEIDIVAFDRRREMVVFTEVKTRTVSSENYPVRSALTGHKRRCLKRAITRWLFAHDYDGPGRIDLVCVGNGKIVEHLMGIGSDFL